MAINWKKLWRGDRADAQPNAVPLAVPALPRTGEARMGVLSGTDGRESAVWSRYDVQPFTAGYIGGWQPFHGTPGSEISRERAVVSTITLDLLHSNSVIATLVEGLATYGVGNGFTLSSRPNASALGISEDETRALAHQIETSWAAWAGSPTECDSGGRFNLHQLALQAYKSYLLTGETLALFDWQRAAGALTRTKLKLLDVRQLDHSITRKTDTGSIMQGVEFDQNGRQVALWIRPAALGSFNVAPQAVRIPTRTPWGRQRAVLLLDALAPNQIRVCRHWHRF